MVAVIGRGALGDAEAHLIADLTVLAHNSAGPVAPIALAAGPQSAAVFALVPLSLGFDQPWTLEISWTSLGALLVLGAVFLGGRLSREALFGMTLIVMGAWLVNRRRRHRPEGEWLEP